MIQKRLILIGGIAGTRKTTNSKIPYRIINRLQGNAILYNEFDQPHPKIDLFIQNSANGKEKGLCSLDGYILFIDVLKRLSDRLFRNYNMPKLAINISKYGCSDRNCSKYGFGDRCFPFCLGFDPR
jgi:hypothetical protein